MEFELKKFIDELRKQGMSFVGTQNNPDAKINTWYVVAKLEEILLNNSEKKR